MSDAWSSKVDELKMRIKDAVSNAEGEVDRDAMLGSIREAIAKAGSEVDTEAVMARVKDVVGKTESKVDAEKIRQWVDDVDKEKMRSWLDEAKTLTAGAAAVAAAQGERLAERAPGAVDKLLGAAKEMFGDVTGNEEIAREGEMDQLRGDITERLTEPGKE